MTQQYINNEKALFYNDLKEYRISNEGKALQSALNSGDTAQIEQAAARYYTARARGALHYESETELQAARALDEQIAQLLHDLD